jgi:hypothetical protein
MDIWFFCVDGVWGPDYMWLAFVDIVIAMTRDDSVARVDWRVVDAVDEDWASERLPDDGAMRARA